MSTGITGTTGAVGSTQSSSTGVFSRRLTPAHATLTDIAATLNSAEGASRLLLPEVVRLVKLALVIPATSASAERSFSGLRGLKTYIRSSMGQPRLNYLLLLYCYRDRLDQLDTWGVAQPDGNNAVAHERHSGTTLVVLYTISMCAKIAKLQATVVDLICHVR